MVPLGCPKKYISSFMFRSSRSMPTNRPVGRQLRRRSIVARFFLLELDVQAERLKLLDQHVEGFGNASLEGILAPYDRLVDLGPAGDVVGLDRQHLLQRVGG